MTTNEKVIEKLKMVEDPELGIDIWTLGLIYDINIENKKRIKILMTFTSPLCPVGDELVKKVENILKKQGWKEVKVEVTFTPPWQPKAELREALGI